MEHKYCKKTGEERGVLFLEMNLAEAWRELTDLNPKLKRFVEGELIFSSKDRFMGKQLRFMQDKLDEVVWKIDYLSNEVTDEGYLVKRNDGRYALSTNLDEYWTCGRAIEVFIIDEEDDYYNDWVLSRVEYNEDYYIVACPNMPMEGLRVRVRR